MTKEEAKEKIMEALRQGGGFMNNIVGSALRDYAKATSTELADTLVDEMGLERLAGIKKVGKK